MPDDFDFSKPVSRNSAGESAVPYLTIAVITLCVLLTAVSMVAPTDNPANPYYKIVHVIQFSPEQVWNGRIVGLFTALFIHVNLVHLLFNMFWTWKMGSTLELSIPRWKYVLFFVSATMISTCCELAVTGQIGTGASGAGYALMGVLWGGRGYHPSWRNLATRENLNLFLIWGVLCIFLTVANIMPVANAAHFGGLLFGLAIGNLFFAPRRKPVWISALVFLGALCLLSLTWVPWAYSWNWHKGIQAYRSHRYQDAIAYYERSLREGGDRSGLLTNIALSWYAIGAEEGLRHHNDVSEAAFDKGSAIMAEAKGEAPPSKRSEDSSDDKNEAAPDSVKPQSVPSSQPPKSKKGQ